MDTTENLQPISRKPHQIPFAFRNKVIKELERLESEEIKKNVNS